MLRTWANCDEMKVGQFLCPNHGDALPAWADKFLWIANCVTLIDFVSGNGMTTNANLESIKHQGLYVSHYLPFRVWLPR